MYTVNLFTEEQMKQYKLEAMMPKSQSIHQKSPKFFFIIHVKKEMRDKITKFLEPQFVRGPLTKEEQEKMKAEV